MISVSEIIIASSIFLQMHVDAIYKEQVLFNSRTRRSTSHLSLKYWVNDGCNTKGFPETIGSFQEKSHLAGVRCCSNDGSICETPGNCPTDNMSFDDAAQECAGLGKRLCTKDELLAEICCGTGGMCNLYEVWTSTPSYDWNKEEHKFCRRCSTFYDTFEEAKSACIDDLNCEAVYDLFCDGDGSFCTCNALSVIEQPHPKGMDCIYRKPRVP